jgi:hypothetical protein
VVANSKGCQYFQVIILSRFYAFVLSLLNVSLCSHKRGRFSSPNHSMLWILKYCRSNFSSKLQNGGSNCNFYFLFTIVMISCTENPKKFIEVLDELELFIDKKVIFDEKQNFRRSAVPRLSANFRHFSFSG